MADPVLKIGGVDKTTLVKVDTVSYERALNRRGDMQCLLTVGNVFRPAVGDPITISQNSTDLWAGIVEDVEESAEPGSERLMFSLKCADWWRFLDKRLYAGDIGGESLYAAMTRLSGAILAEEGFSISGVPNPGPTISNVYSFNYSPASEVLAKLSQITGYLCHISPAKVITFSLYSSNPAPFSLTWGSENWRDIRIRRSLNDPGFRNRQIVRSQYAVTSNVTENFTGDGSTADFFVSQFITSVVSVTVGGVPQVVGRFGVDGPVGAFDVYYDVDGVGLHFYTTGTATPNPPGFGVAIVVVYVGPYRNLIVAQNAASIAARAAIEGGSGKWDSISEERNVSDANMLNDLATGLLRANDDIFTRLDYRTDTSVEPDSATLAVGHRQTVDLTAGPHDVNGTFLIETIKSRWTRTADVIDDIWQYDITATDGEPFQRPEQILKRILEVGRIGPDSATAANESTIDGGSIRLVYGPESQSVTGSTTLNAPVAAPQQGALWLIEVTQGGGGSVTWGTGVASSQPATIPDTTGSKTWFIFCAKSDNLFYLAGRLGVS